MSFFCQRCKQLIVVRLGDDDEGSAFADDIEDVRGFIVQRAGTPLSTATSGGGQSYVVLSDAAPTAGSGDGADPSPSPAPHAGSGDGPGPGKGERGEAGESVASMTSLVSLTERVLAFAHEQSGVDQPLCGECTDKALAELRKELGQAQEEQKRYTAFAAELADAPTSSMGDGAGDGSGVGAAASEAAMAAAREELRAVEERRARVSAQLATLEAEKEQLDALERQYWQDYNNHALHQQAFLEERDSVKCQLRNANKELELLMHTSVFNDAFWIWHNGHFGTINGLRLGRLPSVPVPWDEINAALGHAVLLLDTLAQRQQYTFSRCRLVPNGSFSRVERTEGGNSSTGDLFGSEGGWGRVGVWYGRLDRGLVMLLECLAEFGGWAEKKSSGEFALPYKIDGDTIGELSIKVSGISNHQERWTKALKYFLTDLKWLLGWCVAQS